MPPPAKRVSRKKTQDLLKSSILNPTKRKEDNISSADITVKVIISNISKNIKDIKRVKNIKKIAHCIQKIFEVYYAYCGITGYV